MAMPLLIELFHRDFQPQLQQSQHATVADPPGERSHQLVMWDAIEIAGQVRVHHFGVPLSEIPFDLAYPIQGAAAGR